MAVIRDRLPLVLLLVLAAALMAPVLDLPFWSSDDWLHVDLGAGLVAGDPEAWRRAFTGQTSGDASRLVGNLAWGVNVGLFGMAAWGYYLTNLLVVLGLGALTFLIARQREASGAVAAAAAAIVVFGAAALQPLYFLGARDDAFAALFGAAALASWPWLRARRWGVLGTAGLVVLAGLSKPSALAQVPPILVGLEWLERRRGPAARGVVVQLAALVTAVGIGALLLWLAVEPGELAMERAEAGSELLGRRAAVLAVPSLTLKHGLSWVDGLRLGLLLVGLAIWRSPNRDLGLLGLGGLVAGVLPLLPWLLAEGDRGDLGSRYLLIPAIGAALLLAAALPRGKWGDGLGVGVALLAALSWADVGRHELTLQDSTSDDLIEAMAEVDGPVLIGVRQPDWGTTSLLASHAWTRAFGPERPGVFLQGSRTVRRAATGPYEYGMFDVAETGLDLRAEQRTVLVQVPTESGLRWQIYGRPRQTPMAEGAAVDVKLGPTHSRFHETFPWHLAHPVRMQEIALPIDVRNACELELGTTMTSRHQPRPSDDASLIPDGRFALLSFGGAEDFFVLPAGEDVWLANVAGAAGKRLRILPSNLPSDGGDARIAVLPCER